MTAKDSGGGHTDDMSFDLSTAQGLDYYTPTDPGCPYPVEILLLPTSNAVGGYLPPLTGTGFDSGDSYMNVFGAGGNPATEKSSASPTVTLTWVPDPSLPSDPPPKVAYLLVQSRAEAYASGDPGSFVGTATASNGLGSSAIEMSGDTSWETDKVSWGSQVVMRDGSSGSVTVTGSPSATAIGNSSDPAGSAWAQTALAFTVSPVDVSIGSPSGTGTGTGGGGTGTGGNGGGTGGNGGGTGGNGGGTGGNGGGTGGPSGPGGPGGGNPGGPGGGNPGGPGGGGNPGGPGGGGNPGGPSGGGTGTGGNGGPGPGGPAHGAPTLGGVTVGPDGSLLALTGQQVSAKMNFSGIPLDSKTVHYLWTTSSANAFETWDETAPNAAHATQMIPLSDADRATDTFKFYDEIGGDSVTVTCTVTFTFLDGSPGTFTATSPAVTFYQPTANWLVNQWAGHPAKFLHDNNNSNPSFGAVVNWYPITVTVPPPFDTLYANNLGTACITQVGQFVRANIGSSAYNQSVTWQNLYVVGSDLSAKYLVTGPTALDGPGTMNPGFSYPNVFAVDSNGSFTNKDGKGDPIPINIGQINQGQWPVGQSVASGDSPTQVDNPAGWPDANARNIFWNTATATDTFNTWLMYRPPTLPGYGSVWVPLQWLGWAWSGNASNAYDAAKNPNSEWQAHGPTPAASQGSPTTSPPEWSVTLIEPVATHP